MDDALKEFLSYCRKNMTERSRVKSVKLQLEKLQMEVYVACRTARFIKMFYLIKNSDSITREFIKVISNTWRDMCEEMFFLFRAYDVLSPDEYRRVLGVLLKMMFAVFPGTINLGTSSKIMESVDSLLKIVGHDDCLTRKIFRFHSVIHLNGYTDVLDFILKVRSVVDPREHDRLDAMVNNYRQGMFGENSIIECVQRIAIEVSTDNGYLGERFINFVRESGWFYVPNEIPIVPERTVLEDIFREGGTSNGQTMQHCAADGNQPIDIVISRDFSLLQISETDRDYRNYQTGNQDEGSNEKVEQLNDLSASLDEKFRFESNPYDLQIQSSPLNPQSSPLNPQSIPLNPQSSPLNPQSIPLNPQPNSLNTQASSFNPQANSFDPQANYKEDSTENMGQSDDLPATKDGIFWIRWLANGGKLIDDSQAFCFDQGDMVKKDKSGWLSNDSGQGKSEKDEVDPNGKIGDNPNPGCKTEKTKHLSDDSGSHDDTESKTMTDPYLEIPGRAEKTKGKTKTVQSVGDKMKMWANKSKDVDEVKEKQLSDNDSSAIEGVEKESVEPKTCDDPKRDGSKVVEGTGNKNALGDESKSSSGDQSKICGDFDDKGDHEAENCEQGKKGKENNPSKKKKRKRKKKF